MQQTSTSASTAAASAKASSVPEHTVSIPVTVATSLNNAISLPIKSEQFTAAPASTSAQVITVVAPSHTTQAHGQPVVVQVSSGGQFIAVAVSPENSGQTNSTQSDGTTVTASGATASTDEDDGHSGFEDFATAAYTNGTNAAGTMAYYTADSYTTATANYYSSVTYSQGVNQILTDGAYLVMEQTDPTLTGTASAQRTSPQTDKHNLQQHESVTSSTNAATTLLINPFALHTDHSTSSASVNVSLPSTTSLQQHQNVRDMDIVHVQWLIENYETAEGVSLPRSTLYTHYQSHCSQHNIEPVNAASFGKLIRSVFIGLRTRRLGTRGNSKYHYYGIRVKPGSPLARLNDTAGTSTITNDGSPNPPPAKRAKSSSTTSSNVKQASTENPGPLASATPEVLQTYLGDPTLILPTVWPELPNSLNNENETQKIFSKFAAKYRAHYDEIVTALGNLQFSSIEMLWHHFWQRTEATENNEFMSLSQLQQLTASTNESNETTTIPAIVDWIIQTDYTMYNSLISSLLLPNLLRPIPQNLTQQIRNFAKNITQWMNSALIGYDEEFIALKVAAVGAFSHTLRRYTSLNHLSSAARAVLQNQQQIHQMINDLNRVDFKNVQEQASWVCQCDDEVVEQIEQSFKLLLQESNPFDKWGVWCEQILDMCLTDDDVRSATQFFFKWGFYSSLVMRDLTLRSASSFGSFHLIRLLYDEYIFYLIEHRVAKATGKTPLQVLGEARSLRNRNLVDVNEPNQ